jgi:hypothetical protein
MSKSFYGNVKLKQSPSSGAGDPLLTRDETSGEVGSVTSGVTSLTDSYIFVGNASNVPTAVAVTGDITISNAGVVAITAGSIVNADINASAAIALTKLASQTASRAAVFGSGGFLEPSSVTATEIGYSSGLSGNIQTQFSGKQDTITGAASTVTTSNLSANIVPITNGSGKFANSTTSATALGYVSNLTSDAQTQIDGKLSVTLASPASGDVIINDSGTWTNLAAGSNGQVLTISGGVPSWQNGTSNGIPAGGTAEQMLHKVSGTDYDVAWHTPTLSDIGDVTASADDVNILMGADAAGLTPTIITYLTDITGPVQAQINNKQSSSLAYNSLWVGNSANLAGQLSAGSNGSVLTIVSGVPTWQTPPSPGTFSGPVSSTDNAVVRFNGIGGNAGQNSGVIISDTDDVSGITTLSTGQVSVLNQAAVRLYETGSTNYVAVRASGTMAGDYTITLPDAAPGANTFLKYDGANYVWAAGGGGASAFTDLTDVPVTYVGQALKGVRVNAGETALEFYTISTPVTSVTGTASRISSTGGTTPVIDIDAAYVGQASITTLGTVTTGTWNATTIAVAKGGTGLTALGTANQLLRVNAGATALEYFTPTYISGNESITLSGDVSGTGTTAITATIGANAVSDAKLRQSAGLSVIGRTTNSTGNVADIAGTDGQVLRVSGTSLAFGSIDLTASVGSSILPVANGGTGSSTVPYWTLASGGTLSGNNTIALGSNTLAYTYTGTGTTVPHTVTNSITATANNQVLTALDLNNTFATGGFTGTSNVGLRLRSGRTGLNISTGTISATLVVRGEGSTSATINTALQNSGGSTMFEFGNDAVLRFGTAGSPPQLGAGDYSTGSASISGTAIYMGGALFITNSNQGLKFTGSRTISSSTDSRTIYNNVAYNFTSGTNTIYAVDFDPTFTGTTGLTKYGVVIRPTDAKSGFGLGTGVAPTALVDTGASTTTLAGLRIRSGTAPSAPNSGDFWFDGSNLKFYDGTTTRTLTWV